MNEISLDELNELPAGTYTLIDIRDEGMVSYGMIPGAVNISEDELDAGDRLSGIPADHKLVFY